MQHQSMRRAIQNQKLLLILFIYPVINKYCYKQPLQIAIEKPVCFSLPQTSGRVSPLQGKVYFLFYIDTNQFTQNLKYEIQYLLYIYEDAASINLIEKRPTEIN